MREKSGEDKLTQVYHSERDFQRYSIFDGREVAVQVLGEPDVATVDSYLLMVRVWDPETWSLTAPVELQVSKTASLDQVGAVISAKVGV